MKMVTRLVLVVAALCVSTLTPAADGDKPKPKWSYVEAGYMDFNPDNGLSDNGWFGGGSAGIAMFHVFAEYDDIGDYTFWNAGFGWHGLLGDPADLYFQAQWNDVQVDSSNVSDDGYEVSAGVRWKISRRAANGSLSSVHFIAWNFSRSASVKSSSFLVRNASGPSNARLFSTVSM
jgi:hypothetical protein